MISSLTGANILTHWVRSSPLFAFAYATLLFSQQASLQACHIHEDVVGSGGSASQGCESHMSAVIPWLGRQAEASGRLAPPDFESFLSNFEAPIFPKANA